MTPFESALEDDLRFGVSQYNLPINTVRDLLFISGKCHLKLPNDPKTLLKAKKNYEIVSIGDGSYYHFELENCLLEELHSVCDIAMLQVQLNVDGLPLFKSSTTQFWPMKNPKV